MTLPGPVLNVASEPAHHPGTGVDGAEGEVAAQLLGAPPVQHRLEHVGLGIEQTDVVNQVELGRSTDLDVALHALLKAAKWKTESII